MKFLNGLLLAAAAVEAHYTFPRLVVNGKAEDKDWSVTRQTKNAQSKSGIENPNSADIRCYSSTTAPNIATVPAGSTINYISTQQINHPGPTQYMLARVPAGSSAKSWDGSGSVWWKIATTMPYYDNNKQLVWPAQNTYATHPAVIPASTPNGEYLLRVEQIALHMASQPNKAQFYLSCSQINITNGGNLEPGPNMKVALPGAYRSNDPGIQVNIYNLQPDSYQPPGPPVWQG
ncbi:glycoside hydrolase family 61 protein [Apiosordaria backusii]|uniref:lytic cellulose monooxygenase (C4-dehydrogenating) n=1 Tax=Apiosordaria backusii TaxID=314023 RepID=A0AA39ZS78_9PEZI|nr:glycoside hydrolase family 61 protein [Apiosordaria backusii]